MEVFNPFCILLVTMLAAALAARMVVASALPTQKISSVSLFAALLSGIYLLATPEKLFNENLRTALGAFESITASVCAVLLVVVLLEVPVQWILQVREINLTQVLAPVRVLVVFYLLFLFL